MVLDYVQVKHMYLAALRNMLNVNARPCSIYVPKYMPKYMPNFVPNYAQVRAQLCTGTVSSI
jgi:hypothetical protein